MVRASLGTLENCRISQPGLADWKAWANSSSRSIGCPSLKNSFRRSHQRKNMLMQQESAGGEPGTVPEVLNPSGGMLETMEDFKPGADENQNLRASLRL